LVRRGAIDSFFGNLVIEFEYDLRKTGDHALLQLRNYVTGAWHEDGSSDRPYLAVASDGAEWRVYAPTLTDPAKGINAENITLTLIEKWERTSATGDASGLRFFLNRLFFRRFLIKPTAENFARDFGLSSPACLHALSVLTEKLTELSADSQLQVYQKAWIQSLEISYGSIEADDVLFARHTYLAILARLLVWAAFERRALDPQELPDILSGLYFRGKQLGNLVEEDFFRWHTIPSGSNAASVWIALSHHLAGYDLSAVKEDVLKPLYEQLVDPDTRHVLGEYYTPDWLAIQVVEAVLKAWHWNGSEAPYVLDPACGSGTFIRALIDYMRSGSRLKLSPRDLLEMILSRVMGIDVHPLAVIIARATYALAVRDLVADSPVPVNLPIFLANSLTLPSLEKNRDLYGEELLSLKVADKVYEVPVDLLHDGAAYDATIEDVLAVARAYGKVGTAIADAPNSFRNKVGKRLDKYDKAGDLVDRFGAMAQQIAQLIRDRRNSVHGFLLKNHYRPSMLRHSFDYVVGNPPWLTVGSVKTPEYKDLIVTLASISGIAPRSVGDQSHTELATIFLAICFEHFLRESPRISGAAVGLVMPRSVFTARHHRNLRQGLYKTRFDVIALWDLEHVEPLFKIPSCVLFAESGKARPSLAKDGFAVSGHLPRKDTPPATALPLLNFEKTSFVLDFLGKRSTWRPASAKKATEFASKVSANAYTKSFRQGAILYPQTLLVVEPEKPLKARKGTIRVRTSKAALENAKIDLAKVNHIVDAESLFFTAAGDHILTYTPAVPFWMVLLPSTSVPGDKSFGTVSADTLREKGLTNTAEWLDWAERQWSKVRKKGDKKPLHERLDYLHQLSAQAGMARYVVVYTAAAKRPVACVIDTQKERLPFVARDRTYWASFKRANEAHYVAAFLNSDYAAAAILDWMNKGLFGPRDINKRVLDVPWPRFDRKNSLHTDLAKASRALARNAAALRSKMPDMVSGLQRTWLRARLNSAKLKAIEELVKQIALEK
jgi:hypothetical protein